MYLLAETALPNGNRQSAHTCTQSEDKHTYSFRAHSPLADSDWNHKQQRRVMSNVFPNRPVTPLCRRNHERKAQIHSPQPTTNKTSLNIATLCATRFIILTIYRRRTKRNDGIPMARASIRMHRGVIAQSGQHIYQHHHTSHSAGPIQCNSWSLYT